jgi:hypothetical protein
LLVGESHTPRIERRAHTGVPALVLICKQIMRQRIRQELCTPNLEAIMEELVVIGKIVGNVVNLDGVSYLQFFGPLTQLNQIVLRLY